MTPLTGPLAHWPTDSPNYKEMLSHLKMLAGAFDKIALHKNALWRVPLGKLDIFYVLQIS